LEKKKTPQSHWYSVLGYLLNLPVTITALQGQEGNDSGQASEFCSHLQWIFGTFSDGKRAWIKGKESEAQIYRITRNGNDMHE
jgi:hypothetical protein